jgi:hypothetical protein
MPAVSDAQRKMMAIAEHHPEKLHKENKGVLSMSQKQLHEFASTKGLGKKKKAADTLARAKKAFGK